jgi:Lrp/AsnC family leucine-responsive transcriptional regulator
VQEVHHVAGEDCYIAKVRVADTEALGKLLREKIGVVPAVKSTRTTIVLETVKESMTLPIDSGIRESVAGGREPSRPPTDHRPPTTAGSAP